MLERISLFALLVVCCSFAAAQDEPDDAIHEELRGLLGGIESAVNDKRYGDLGQYFHENMRITTIRQEVLSSRDEIEPYFMGWFGEGGFLSDLRMTLEADALTELYANKTIGVVEGSGDEDYILSDGRTFAMKTRWTATVIRDTDGVWRILTLHIGTDFVDNPLVTEIESAVQSYAIKGGIGGAILGLIVGFFAFRRRAA